MEIFDNAKHRDDHQCPLWENTGNSLICHRHKSAQVFYHQKDLDEHLKTHGDVGELVVPKLSCPVCQKVEFKLVK